MIINYQSLKYFETVAQVEHFTNAAQLLCISQSALSKSMSALEAEIGVPLFEKKGRNIHLTTYGRILRDYVQSGIGEIDQGIKRIQSLANIRQGTVHISSIFSLGALFIPTVIQQFSLEYPSILLQYSQKTSASVLRDLLDGTIDIGFCGEFLRDVCYAPLDREIILTEEFCLLVPLSHPLAGRKSVSLLEDEIWDNTFIGYNEDTGIALSLADSVRKIEQLEGLHYLYRASELNTIASFVRAGLGIAIVPISPAVRTYGLSVIGISRPFLSRNIYMVWNSEQILPPAADALKRYVSARNWNLTLAEESL